MLSANEEVEPSSSFVERIEKNLQKDTSMQSTFQTSVSSINEHIPIRSKSPVILVSRLTEKDLRLHGVRDSSISPTDRSRPKKRPRLHLSPTTAAPIEGSSSSKRENRISKSADRPKKVLELFGDDSDDSEPTSTQRKVAPLPDKTQKFNPDDLDYDFEVDEGEDNAPSQFSNEASVEKQPQNKKRSENNHRSKSSKSSKKDKSSEKEKRSSKEKKKKDDEKSKTTEKETKSTEKSRNKEGTLRKENHVTSGNSNKFRIPKIVNSVTAPCSAGSVGLPLLVQQNLEQNLKGSAPPPSIKDSSPSLASDACSSKHDSPTKPNSTANPSPILSERSNTPVEPITHSETFQLFAEPAPGILCMIPSKKDRAKSVVFTEPESSTHNMSPRDELSGTLQDMVNEGKQFPKELINNYLIELEYEPQSSQRPPVPGVRPL